MDAPREVASLPIGTSAGEFGLRAFEAPSGRVYLLMGRGDLGDGRSILTRLHSECLTGDALGSLRCDCGIQLRLALGTIAAEGRGVLVYATGHEGRGIGLVNKLRAYMLQDAGMDTVEANRHLGLPVDGRDHVEVGAVLSAAGIRSVRLLTNNPEKARGLRAAGLTVEAVLPIRTAPHARNVAYLRTKRQRLGHLSPDGVPLPVPGSPAIDVSDLLGPVRPRPTRPYVVLKYAQSLDGRIATSAGDSKWISGEAERRVSHALRAACDAVLVGSGTVRRDDPQLTVRLVPGASPLRVVLDSRLSIPLSARVADGSVRTAILTRPAPDSRRAAALRRRGVVVLEVPAAPRGVELEEGLAELRRLGVETLLVEGGARVITSLLLEGLADRVIVGIAPILIGSGTEAVGDLGITEVVHGIELTDRAIHPVGSDVLLAGDVHRRSRAAASGPAS
ncbi:MAG TPA: GTP cyclohydrolase II RibA [Actinomycetota bacterium]|nr:GTP cyclohydrolase II RibA [Actinomycetota bacterium]